MDWLYVTPTIALSLSIESETSSLAYGLIQLKHFGLALIQQPFPLTSALLKEVDKNGPIQLESEIFDSGTLRLLDTVLFLSNASPDVTNRTLDKLDQYYSRVAICNPIDLAFTLALEIGIVPMTPSYGLLESSILRVQHSYKITKAVAILSEVVYDSNSIKDQNKLKEVWKSYQPDEPLVDMISKQWSNIGFQGKDPSTDFRGCGMLALEALLYFGKETDEMLLERILAESVDGGQGWYPFALASISMTKFCLELGEARDLQLMLLRSLQIPPEDGEINIEPFLRIQSDLLILFHSHWRKGNYTVMQFEKVFSQFKQILTPWIRRGVIDARALDYTYTSKRIE